MPIYWIIHQYYTIDPVIDCNQITIAIGSVNSFTPKRLDERFISCENALSWKPLDLTNEVNIGLGITRANVDPVICRHVKSLGHN